MAILMKSTPSLAMVRISAIPSAASRASTPMEVSGTPIQVGYQSESPWRLVIWRPEQVMRGPVKRPASMASRIEGVTRPLVVGSASEVKPAASTRCAASSPRSARNSTGA